MTRRRWAGVGAAALVVAIEHSSVGIVLVDADDAILYASPSADRLYDALGNTASMNSRMAEMLGAP